LRRISTYCRFGVSVIIILAPLLIPAAWADDWYELYKRGQSELDRGNYEKAIREFEAAIQIKSQPEAQATTSGLNVVVYVPYFRLGQAYLLAGQYQRAIDNFGKSKKYGAINNTPYRRSLERHLEMAEDLQWAVATKAPEIEERFATVERLILAERYNEAESILTQVKQTYDSDKRIAVYETWLQEARSGTQKESSGIESAAQTRFNQGLDYYLSGQYEEALREFQAAERIEPGFGSVTSWITKTRRDIERLNAEKEGRPAETPAPEVIEKVVRQTTQPVIAMSSPTRAFSEVRASTVRFAGQIGDDQGLARIDVVLNGQPLLSATSDSVQIRANGEMRHRFQNQHREFVWGGANAAPDSVEDVAGNDIKSTKCTFSLDIPLQLGENQIVLTATDIDSVSHRTVEQLTVTRQPPLHRTAVFWIILGALALLATGGLLLSKMIKYRIAIVNKYNPYIAGSPIRTEEMFFGREKLIQRIINTLHNNSLMLYGPRRIGKTSLQHQLKHRLESLHDPQYEFVPVLIDLQGTSEHRFFASLMEEIMEVYRSRSNGALPLRFFDNQTDYSGRDFSRDLKKVMEAFQAQTEKTLKLVLLIDEVDELNKYSEEVNQRLRSVFMKTFAENLVAVMSGAYIRKNWESEGSPWYNFFEQVEVPPFAREDAEALIREPVKGIFEYDEAAIRKIIELSGCQPYVIQRFCINVINRIIEDKRRRVSVADVEAIAGHILKDDDS